MEKFLFILAAQIEILEKTREYLTAADKKIIIVLYMTVSKGDF